MNLLLYTSNESSLTCTGFTGNKKTTISIRNKVKSQLLLIVVIVYMYGIKIAHISVIF